MPHSLVATERPGPVPQNQLQPCLLKFPLARNEPTIGLVTRRHKNLTTPECWPQPGTSLGKLYHLRPPGKKAHAGPAPAGTPLPNPIAKHLDLKVRQLRHAILFRSALTFRLVKGSDPRRYIINRKRNARGLCKSLQSMDLRLEFWSEDHILKSIEKLN